MTCKEKMMELYPHMDWGKVVVSECPSDYSWLCDPEYCGEHHRDGEFIESVCERCWNREIPENENKKENEKMNACEFTCEEKAKLIKDIKTRTDEVVMLEDENQRLRDKLAKCEQQTANQRNLIERKDEVINDYRSKLKNFNQTNEDLANKLAAERAMVGRLDGMVTTRDEEIAKLVKEIEEFEEAVNAKNKRIAELCARIDKLDEARYIEQDIAATKELAEKFNSCGNDCALIPTDIARAIAMVMRTKYDALTYVGFSHDDAMSLIPMWND